MLGRALLKRCPLCGAGKLFTGWFRMKERCPGCGYHHPVQVGTDLCENCGEPIAPARLEARPATPTCLDCAV